MAEMSVFARASVTVQFRTELPTQGEARLQRQQEYAHMLSRIRTAVGKALEECQTEGWQAVVTNIAE
jgi:hypothetical protein